MNLDLRHFVPSEFHGWWALTSPRLLVVEDVFRSRWGDVVEISPHPRAVGRRNGPEDTSQHNVDRWGEVRAVDSMPRGLRMRADAERAVRIATEAGASGIGIYPHWTPAPGIHIDVRADALPGDPALWGGVQRTDAEGRAHQVLISLDEALRAFPTE